MRKPVIEVHNDKSQGPSLVLRQFSKRVSGSGILRNARSSRYHSRSQSELAKKRSALKRMEKRKTMQKLIKLGKAPVMKKRRF